VSEVDFGYGDHDAWMDQDPTLCYWPDCSAENQVLLHLLIEPDRFSDLCREHALEAFDDYEEYPTLRTCSCLICRRARMWLSVRSPEDG